VFSFYEFFAGGGMARAGLGESSQCLFANDVDYKKSKSYAENWGAEHLLVAGVHQIQMNQLPGVADLVWASFPCQDLSQAGVQGGLKEKRSGSFWPFWRLMKKLVKERRAPKIIVLENVCGTITSNSGSDFSAIADSFSRLNYRFGAVVVDAAKFVPQSRARLFFVGVHSDIAIPSSLLGSGPNQELHPKAMIYGINNFTKAARNKWVWWSLPSPANRAINLIDILENEPTKLDWHSKSQTQNLLDLMSGSHLNKVMYQAKSGRLAVGSLFKRMRQGAQRAEVRFDGIAGCLRTPSGGSSKQIILVIKDGDIKSRLISPREGARLMGLSDTYKLPSNDNDAYRLIGDGVAVPVVDYLSRNLFQIILNSSESFSGVAA
jgi:DNA (cytosine-5)-methyltransferase 1